ncbi:MAG: hypothetical protein R8P61_10910 [Bacteroidia bacterium]|nr:hypothetical protein [Bacteroidia bacterium]
MSRLISSLVFLFFLISVTYGQSCAGCSEGQSRGEVEWRSIPPGNGQEFTGNFRSVSSMYFVQFAVYPSSIACYKIKAPQGLGMIWLINHPGTRVKGQSRAGAFYIVKAFKSKYQAQLHVNEYKRSGFECWYNPALTGSNFHIERIFM